MGSKLVFAVIVVAVTLGVLIYSASTQTAKAVVTVSELLDEGGARARIRLGARVGGSAVQYVTQPERQVRFSVHDIVGGGKEIPVVYNGTMPDTLKSGRDVILEGDYDGQRFVAKSLMTQCPSKYEPPMPGVQSDGSRAGGIDSSKGY